MKNDRVQRLGRAVAALAALGALAAAGCVRPSTLRIESLKDPYFPETFESRFDVCAYRSAAGELWVVGRASAELPPAGDAESAGVAQILEARLFWQPRPGKTPADSSTITANVRFLLKTAGGAALYEGTAFVYPHAAKPGRPMRVDIESAHLKPTRQTGAARDWLGEMKLTGRLYAADDGALAVDLSRSLDLALGAAGQ